jgi:hypothetical protein
MAIGPLLPDHIQVNAVNAFCRYPRARQFARIIMVSAAEESIQSSSIGVFIERSHKYSGIAVIGTVLNGPVPE